MSRSLGTTVTAGREIRRCETQLCHRPV